MTSDSFCSNLLRDMRILFPWVWSNFLWVPVPWTVNEYTVSIINQLNIKILFLSTSYLRNNCLPRRTRRSPGSETYSLTCETKTYFTRWRTQRMAFPVYVSSIPLHRVMFHVCMNVYTVESQLICLMIHLGGRGGHNVGVQQGACTNVILLPCGLVSPWGGHVIICLCKAK